jgi:hypothetical protein
MVKPGGERTEVSAKQAVGWRLPARGKGDAE